MDEDLDYAIALSLQEESKPSNFVQEKDPGASCANNGLEDDNNLEAMFEKMDEDLDFAFALSMQDDLNKNVSKQKKKVSFEADSKLGIVDPQWELIDPNPDIHGLFIEFNAQFFFGKLEGIEVKWSPRMTLCAGVCCYEGRGGLCSVRLSLPLLKLRPRRDLVETLLHEMIHAYLFVTANNKDHDGHGPEFCSHMYRINKETGTTISIYHSFHDEVDVYRKHWWKCSGPCQKNKPYFGLVKRAMNRPPGPKDNWFAQHQATCGGTFVKIKEPEDYKAKNLKRKSQDIKASSSPNIKSFFQHSPKVSESHNPLTPAKKPNNMGTFGQSNNIGLPTVASIKSVIKKTKNTDNFGQENNVASLFRQDKSTFPENGAKSFDPFSGHGHRLGSSSSKKPISFLSSLQKELVNSKAKPLQNSNSQTSKVFKTKNTDGKKQSIPNSKQSKGLSRSSPKLISQKTEKSKLLQSALDTFVISSAKGSKTTNIKTNSTSGDFKTDVTNKLKDVMCPVCMKLQPNGEINRHLDTCLN